MNKWLALTCALSVCACGARTGLSSPDSAERHPDGAIPSDTSVPDAGEPDASELPDAAGEPDAGTDASAGQLCGGSCFSGCAEHRCERAIQVAAGSLHTCTLLDSGRVACWGSNGLRQLGDGTITNRGVPGPVIGVSDAVELAVGGLFSCARLSSGRVRCWGRNSSGELGGGSADSSHGPTFVEGLGDAIHIASGNNSSCAVRSTHEIVCWGFSLESYPSTPSLRTPGVARGVRDFISVTVGGRHACGLQSGGSILCWGANNSGQLGVGTTTRVGETAEPVLGISDAVEVVAGEGHTCARRESGEVLCWGNNTAGQLGFHGSSQATPALTDVSDAVELSAGLQHTCVRHASGEVSCWGADRAGQLGHEGWAPARVEGLTSAIEVHAGSFHTCARRSAPDTGTTELLCWGSNATGQLGDGSFVQSVSPVLVSL